MQSDLTKPTSTDWVPYRYSWQSVYRLYKDDTSSTDPAFWSYLNQAVRGILMDDIRRAKYGMNFGLERDDMPKISNLLSALKDCKKDSNCVRPNFTAELKAVVARVPVYTYFESDLDNAKTDSDKRNIIEQYAEQLEYDYFMHSSVAEASIRPTKVGSVIQLEVPIYAPDFNASDRKLVAQAVEPRWKSDKLAVKVKFEEQPGNIFQALFDPSPSGRIYVNQTKKQLQMYAYNSTLSLAHEFGHILGFSDHYYTTYDFDNCLYTQWNKPDDIMSDSDTGSVTKEEWDWLETAYPVK